MILLMPRIRDLTTGVLCLIGATVTVVPVVEAIECTCRAPGRRVELGATICLPTADGPRLARCEMDLNITSWKILPTPCVLSQTPIPAAERRTAALGTAIGR